MGGGRYTAFVDPGGQVILAILATLIPGIFAGAALYVTLVEHPARLSAGTPSALKEFAPSYHRGAAMQASLSAIGLLLSLIVYVQSHERGFLVAGFLLALPFPFTLIAIKPTNQRLLSPDLAPESPEAMRLLQRWGHLHLVRMSLGLASFLTALYSLATRTP